MAELGLDSGPLCTPPSEIYKYTPVDSEANEIRIAHIIPGSKNDPLICQLKNVLLRENPAYEALSYTWGTQTNCVEVSIDGKRASISKNLESALRRLRLTDKVLTIWVDSICIDQSDLVERSAQASRMRFIYHQACSVSVWLGDGDEEKEDGVLASTLLHDLDSASEDTFNQILGDPERFIQFQALKALFRRSYWFRIWVIQEVTVGQTVTVYWGNQHSIPWTRLKEICAKLEARTEYLNSHYPDDPTSVFSLSSGGPKHLQLTKWPYKGSQPSLLELLHTHMGKFSTNPLDKVYALIGISSSRDTFGPIDYNRSIVDTYTHTARHIITTSHNLDVICACQNEDVQYDLPSWVPDWERRLEYPKHRIMGLQIRVPSFQASGRDSTAIVSFSEDSKTLIARGIIIDTIEALSSKFWKNSKHEKEKKIIDTLQAFREWWSLYTDSKGTDASVEEFNSSFCGGSWAASYDIHHEKRVETFCSLFKELLPHVEFPSAPSFAGAPTEIPEVQRSTVSAASLRMHNKHFAVSEKAKLACLAPANTKRGDYICLLLGCNYPVLLRKVESHYILIGEIFVNGIMYGETSFVGKDMVDFQIH